MYESEIQSKVTTKILEPNEDNVEPTTSSVSDNGKLVLVDCLGLEAAYTVEEARRLANEIEGDMDGGEDVVAEIRKMADEVESNYE